MRSIHKKKTHVAFDICLAFGKHANRPVSLVTNHNVGRAPTIRTTRRWKMMRARGGTIFLVPEKSASIVLVSRWGADRCSTSYTIGKRESWNSNACNDTARRCHAITHRSLMSRWWMDPCYLIDNSETRRKNGMLPCIGEYLRLGSVCTDSRKCRPLRMLLFIGGDLVLSSLLAMRSTSFYKRYFVHS